MFNFKTLLASLLISTAAFCAEQPNGELTTPATALKNSISQSAGEKVTALTTQQATQEGKQESSGTTISLIDDITRYLLHFGDMKLLQRLTLTSKPMSAEVWKHRKDHYTLFFDAQQNRVSNPNFVTRELHILKNFLEQAPHPVAVKLSNVGYSMSEPIQEYQDKISQLAINEMTQDFVPYFPEILRQKIKLIEQLKLPARPNCMNSHQLAALEKILSLTKLILIHMNGIEQEQNKLGFQWLNEFFDKIDSARLKVKLAMSPVHIPEYINSIGDRYRKLSQLEMVSDESDIHLLQKPEIAEILSDLKLFKCTDKPVNIADLISLKNLSIASTNRTNPLDKPFVLKGPPSLRSLRLSLDGFPETLPEMVGISNLQYLEIKYNDLITYPGEDRNKEVHSLTRHFNPLRNLSMLQSLRIMFEFNYGYSIAFADLFKSLGDSINELEFLRHVELLAIGFETAEHFNAMRDGQKSVDECLEYLKNNDPETSPAAFYYYKDSKSYYTKWQSVDFAVKLMEVQKKIKCKILVS